MAAKTKKTAPRKNGAVTSKQVLGKLDRAHLIEMTRNLADIVTITNPVMKSDIALRRLRREVRRFIIDPQCHDLPPSKHCLTRLRYAADLFIPTHDYVNVSWQVNPKPGIGDLNSAMRGKADSVPRVGHLLFVTPFNYISPRSTARARI